MVQRTAIEWSRVLLIKVPSPGGSHWELLKIVREGESADGRADAEEQTEIGEYQEGVLRAVSDGTLVEIRIVFDEGE